MSHSGLKWSTLFMNNCGQAQVFMLAWSSTHVKITFSTYDRHSIKWSDVKIQTKMGRNDKGTSRSVLCPTILENSFWNLELKGEIRDFLSNLQTWLIDSPASAINYTSLQRYFMCCAHEARKLPKEFLWQRTEQECETDLPSFTSCDSSAQLCRAQPPWNFSPWVILFGDKLRA